STIGVVQVVGGLGVGWTGVALAAVVAIAATVGELTRRGATIRGLVGKVIRGICGTRGSARRRTAMPGLLGAVAVTVILAGRELWQGGVVIVGGFCCAWLIVSAFSACMHVRATTIMLSDIPRELARPLPPGIESRVGEVNSGNLCVYSRHRATALGPFLGSGHRLIRWTTPPVDVTVGRRIEGGERQTPDSVSVMELHARLKQSAEDPALVKLRCQQRIYADGIQVAHSPELLRDPSLGPPYISVDDAFVLS